MGVGTFDDNWVILALQARPSRKQGLMPFLLMVFKNFEAGRIPEKLRRYHTLSFTKDALVSQSMESCTNTN